MNPRKRACIYNDYLRFIKRYFVNQFHKLRIKNKPKIFCIGLNKTGTTSFEFVMKELGFIVGDQREGEKLLHDYAKQEFSSLFKLCKTAQVFQDAPFSFPDTYKYLDQQFPGSKFILTVRDNPDQWYESITRFHSRIWADGRRIPTKEDLQNATYIYKGRPWESNRILFKTPESDPYNNQMLIDYYTNHVTNVNAYFKDRTNDLLIINVAEKASYRRLCTFVRKRPVREKFPVMNKS
ncbi:sulfotransferase [Saccharicrinis sp. FJH54]|uniref:sulfotransferase n=1 Tax=Saccharicrinis sp. FJH54 TaxID=3344665 RepID=UPI0035D50AD2